MRRSLPRPGVIRSGLATSAAALCLLASGCGTVKTSGTARTGTEQLLLTNAWDSALQKVDFRPLTGVPVFLDTTNVAAVDQGWVISTLRQALLSQGVLLREKREQAQWIVEASVGAFGNDQYNMLVGVPQTTIPQTVVGMPAGTIPEISVLKKSHQTGTAKLMMFAYDRGSGRVVWRSGTVIATSNAKDVYLGGMGPFQSGTIRGRTELMGLKIPLTSEQAAADPNAPPRRSGAQPPARPSPAPTDPDLEAFAPE